MKLQKMATKTISKRYLYKKVIKKESEHMKNLFDENSVTYQPGNTEVEAIEHLDTFEVLRSDSNGENDGICDENNEEDITSYINVDNCNIACDDPSEDTVNSELASWANKFVISNDAVSELLFILKPKIPSLPDDFQTLLNTNHRQPEVFTHNTSLAYPSDSRIDELSEKIDVLRENLKQDMRKMTASILGELSAMKQEIKLMNGSVVKSKFTLLPKFPINEKNEFLNMERNASDDRFAGELKQKFLNVGGEDMRIFLKTNIQAMLTDECAKFFSWIGLRDTIATRGFRVFEILKIACQVRHQNATEKIMDCILKKYFNDAKDRLNKKRKYQERQSLA